MFHKGSAKKRDFEVQVIPATKLTTPMGEADPVKRVAAYCRVSTDEDAQASLIETDDQHVRTAVRELKRTGAIVLLDGAEDDLNYQNYMIGLKYSDWTLHNVKEKMELVSGMLTIIKGAKDIAVAK